MARGTHKKGHLADLTQLPAPIWTPNLVDAQHDHYSVEFTPGLRIVHRHAQTKGKLQEFALVLETWSDGAWHPIACADCAHGQDVHIDFINRGNEKYRKQPVREITCENDVLAGRRDSLVMLQGNADDYLRRWEQT